MNLKKKQLILLGAALFGIFLTATAQQSMDLSFQGMLADIEGNRISNEQFDLSLRVLSGSGDLLWETVSKTSTDEEGWFGFPINDISRFLERDGKPGTAVIWLEFLPNDNTRWIRKNDNFKVSYTLSAKSQGETTELVITRMEGTDLMAHVEENLFAFRDPYPFSYLTGGFLVTAPPITKSSKEDLRNWLSPDEDLEESSASRGVKGGFAPGGYRKKK